MAESRQELLAWLNNLLQLNITKVEQCGTGAALCQVFDSIYLDVPMARVKFDAKTEYAYLNNFKILQNHFAKHQIDRPIPVESLVKCKMQDNLEFLQWTKRFWDQYFPGVEYDPLSRRKASGQPAPPPPNTNFGAATRGPTTAGARRPAANTSTARGAGPPRAGSAGGGASAALSQENNALKEMVGGLERERDFYFNKLRQIEMLLQEEVDAHPELEQEEGGLVPRLQVILYSTEEGFEIPAEDGEEGLEEAGLAEEETF